MLTTLLKYRISLSSLKLLNEQPRNLLIHHGLMGSCKNFRTVARNQIVSSRCNTYLIDARNHGESPHTPSHTIQQLADDLYQYIIQNNLNKNLTLMGHSMGGLALMQFTKRHNSPQIQSFIERIIIIDIPSDPVRSYPSFKKTGEMLRNLSKIDLSQPIKNIHEQIDKFAVSKDIAALLKTNIIKDEEGKFRWLVNLKLLAYEGYDNIGKYSLAENNPKLWKKPVQYIYGGKSNYYDAQHHHRYRQNFPSMKDDNFHGVKEAGHWVHADRPTEFLQILDKILQKEDKGHRQ